MRNFDVCKRNNICIEGNLLSEKVIVFAHGFGTDQSAWKDIKRYFEHEYKLILFDNVGAGLSDIDSYNPDKYHSINSYADDLIQICSSLNIRDAIFIGHSVSGMVGLLALKRVPVLFKQVILIGASPRYLDDKNYTGGFTQEILDDIYAQMSANYYEWVGGFSKVAMLNDTKPSLRADFADSLLSLKPAIALQVAKSIFQSDFRSILHEIDHDVLIIQSKNDVSVPVEVGKYLHRSLKNSSLALINAEGHFPHFSAPKEVVTAIKTFLHNTDYANNSLLKTGT